MEVGLDAQAINLNQHLRHEQTQEDELCIDWREEEEGEHEGKNRDTENQGVNGKIKSPGTTAWCERTPSDPTGSHVCVGTGR